MGRNSPEPQPAAVEVEVLATVRLSARKVEEIIRRYMTNEETRPGEAPPVDGMNIAIEFTVRSEDHGDTTRFDGVEIKYKPVSS